MGHKKNIIYPMLFVVVLILASSCASSQQTLSAEEVARVYAPIENRDFYIRATYVSPSSSRVMGPHDLAPGYYLRVSDGQVDIHLPYFGQVYIPTSLGHAEGLSFTAPISDYNIIRDRKQRNRYIEAYFNTTSEGSSYRIEVRVFPDRQADITVRPHHKQTISYSGYIE